jgi:hypothetical protein
MRRNDTSFFNRQGSPPVAPDLGPGYFQTQQQPYGGYPAAPTPFGSNNQLYNPSYVMNGPQSGNAQSPPGFNGTYMNNQYSNNNQFGPSNQPMQNAPWNNTMNNAPVNRQAGWGMNNGASNTNPGSGSFFTGSTYMSGPQSCMAMTGDRISVQSLSGAQPAGK